MKQVHEGLKPKKSYKFDICDTFFHKGDLAIHILPVHEGKKPFKCNICDHKIAKKFDLTKHINEVHEEEKQHLCTICNVSFSRKSSLDTHNIIHKGNKPFKCEKCNSNF